MAQQERPNLRADGERHEEIALDYLCGLGYRLVKRNFRFGRSGEIDLVMRDGDCYVFVEVKTRRSHGFGPPEEAVTPAKRSRIRKVAQGFLYVNKVIDYEARFDVVAIDYVTGNGREPEIRHYRDAF